MKTAILLPTWVGDACMATPMLRAIRNGMPEISELCLVGRYAPLAALEGNPWSDSSVLFKPKSKSQDMLSRRGMVAELKRKQIEAIVLLPNSLSAGLIGYLSGAKHRIGYARDGRGWLLTQVISPPSAPPNGTPVATIDYYLNIARQLGCETPDLTMQLWVSESDRELARLAFATLELDWNHQTVVINTASATGDSRQWPTGHAIRAARELAVKHELQVLIHSGPGDRQKANAVAFGAAHARVKSLGTFDDLPVGLSKAVLERADVVVSTDSGPRHMAVALNKRVVSLFGPTAAEKNRTYNRPESTQRIALPCSPCGKNKCPLVHNNCMAGLSYMQVVAAVLEQFEIVEQEKRERESRLVPRTAA